MRPKTVPMTAGTVRSRTGRFTGCRHIHRCHTHTSAQTTPVANVPGCHRSSTSAVAVPTSAEVATMSDTAHMAAT